LTKKAARAALLIRHLKYILLERPQNYPGATMYKERKFDENEGRQLIVKRMQIFNPAIDTTLLKLIP